MSASRCLKRGRFLFFLLNAVMMLVHTYLGACVYSLENLSTCPYNVAAGQTREKEMDADIDASMDGGRDKGGDGGLCY